MSNLEHYFENLLMNGKDVSGDVNKNALTIDEQNAVEVCAQYVIYTLLPSADIEPVRHGRWHSRHYYRKASNSYDCEVFVCSECQAEFSYDAETGVRASDWNYCPNCGALMEGEQDG